VVALVIAQNIAYQALIRGHTVAPSYVELRIERTVSNLKCNAQVNGLKVEGIDLGPTRERTPESDCTS
jgi:hypothetical protein